MAFILLPFGVFSPQCSALRFNVSSVLLLAQENWYIWPSRTRPPQTSSSALTARGRWLKWACFFTPHSASSTGRLSGNLLLHFQILYLHPLLQLNCRHLDVFGFFSSMTLSSGLIFMQIFWANFTIQPKWFKFLTKSKCMGRKEPWPQSSCQKVSLSI